MRHGEMQDLKGKLVIVASTGPSFRRRISVASNAIQTIDNEMTYLIINCLNCIRCDGNSTSKTGLTRPNICMQILIMYLMTC